ncbi:ribonuclease HII [Bradyrhizobium japonicum]
MLDKGNARGLILWFVLRRSHEPAPPAFDILTVTDDSSEGDLTDAGNNPVETADAINIYWAGIQAMQRAVRGLGLTPQHLLIDAKRLKEIDIPQQAIIKGDTKSASIAAASILAKVERDIVMRTLDVRHPGYGFADHKGYPVPAHYEALARLGACAAHRRSFGPVRKALGLPPLPPWPSASERAAG